jgi:hypothetical protein
MRERSFAFGFEARKLRHRSSAGVLTAKQSKPSFRVTSTDFIHSWTSSIGEIDIYYSPYKEFLSLLISKGLEEEKRF